MWHNKHFQLFGLFFLIISINLSISAAVKKQSKRHYNKNHGHAVHTNCHHNNPIADSDVLSESSSTEVQYYKAPAKYYAGNHEDGHEMFDKVLKQIETTVVKYIKQLESEGKIMLFDTKAQARPYPKPSMVTTSQHFPPEPPTDSRSSNTKLKKYNRDLFEPFTSDGFKTEIYNDINSMVYKTGSKPKSKGTEHTISYHNPKYASSTVTSQYFVHEDDFVPSSSGIGYDDRYRTSASSLSSGSGNEDRYRSLSSGSGNDDRYRSLSGGVSNEERYRSTVPDDYDCHYESAASSFSSLPQQYSNSDYNNDGYPISNPYPYIYNNDKYKRYKKDLGSKCGSSYRSI